MKNKIDYNELQDLLKTHQYIKIKGTILIKFEQSLYLRVIARGLDGNDYWIINNSDILCLLIQSLELCSYNCCNGSYYFKFLQKGILNEK